MLWEIGSDGCEVRALRNRLDLDSGHASRLLRSLEAAGMVRVAPSASDRRIRVAALTRAGLAERALLDQRSDELAESLLTPLDGERRERLVDAMRTVERLLTFAAIEIRPVDPADPDARQCFRAYFAELDNRSESGFDPAAGISAKPHELTPPAGCLLIAYLHSEPVGCGAVKHHAGAPSEIKRMWVSASARGLGIGRRLLTELEARAAESGASTARLETNRALVEAIALYRSAGYREVPAFNDEPFADHWFEKDLPQ
ncbi:MAG TPA: bifunctional helix-turn-helix transcriptional regulator/GNAT family N-acetyltransferase [Beijerinckiaceae bacterium]|nr:bifunctional helix-turn-helix transcriptional regulator/GNAT family N-acetyltransferase [Beijerinckiaceae bacterium]